MKADFIDQKPSSSEHIFTAELLKIGKDRLLGRKVPRMKKILEYIAMGTYFSKHPAEINVAAQADMSPLAVTWQKNDCEEPIMAAERCILFSAFPFIIFLHSPLVPCCCHLHAQRACSAGGLSLVSNFWLTRHLAMWKGAKVWNGWGVSTQGCVSGGKEEKSTGVSQPTLGGLISSLEKSSKTTIWLNTSHHHC